MGLLKRLGLALLILVLASQRTPADSGAADRVIANETLKATPSQTESGRFLTPSKVVDQGAFRLPVALPQQGIILTLSRWGSTTVAFFDVARRSSIALVTKPAAQLQVEVAGRRVAYLSREGVNPANNYIEILDLKKNKRQLIEPARGFAILGFSLSPGGERLVFAQIYLRGSRSDRIAWRIVDANLDEQAARIFLTSPQKSLSSRMIPIPIAWSDSTKEIVLQGLVPFQGMVHQGIWTMGSNGSGLRQIISEPSYSGIPRLSSDGAYLAYLGTRIDTLPPGYVPSPGAPPANILATWKLLTGEESVLSHLTDGVFGYFSWGYSGGETLVSRQEWLEGRFRDVAIQRIKKQATVELRKLSRSPPPTVTGIAECSPGALLWVEEGPTGTTLFEAKPDAAPVRLLTLPDGKIDLIHCLGGRAG